MTLFPHIQCNSISINPCSEIPRQLTYKGDSMTFDPKPIDPGPAPVDENSI